MLVDQATAAAGPLISRSTSRSTSTSCPPDVPPPPAWIARAATLSERLDDTGARTWSAPPIDVAPFVDAWARAVAKGDPTRFERRLAAMGLERDELAVRLQPVVPDAAWVPAAAEIAAVARATPVGAIDDDAAWSDDEAVPFAALWRPYVAWAFDRLAARGVRPSAALRTALADTLVTRLRELGLDGLLHTLRNDLGRAAGTDPYRRWVAAQLAGGLDGIFERVPVLGRVLALGTLQWVATTAEWVTRLDADRTAIADAFGIAADDEVVAILAAGDRHHGGREVLLLDTASGERLVYKPRSLEPELIFAAAAAHLRHHGGVDVDLGLTVIARSGYGWVGFVRPEQSTGPEGVTRFSRRSGALLALCRALAVGDLHFENVIVGGDRPVVVDLECLAQSPFVLAGGVDGREQDALLVDSVLHSGLLPDAVAIASDGLDLAGLTSTAERIPPLELEPVVELGTATMRRRDRVVLPRSRRTSSPANAARSLPIDVDALLAGLRNAEAVLGRHGLGVDLDRSLDIRLIPRGTAVYVRALRSALRPDGLADGLAFSLRLDALAADATGRPAGPADEGDDTTAFGPWRLVVADGERRALEHLDVPLLVADWQSTAARVVGGAVDGGAGPLVAEVVRRSGTDTIRDRLRRLGPTSSRVQEVVTRCSLETVLGPSFPPALVVGADALGAATALARSLQEAAVPARGGRLRWVNTVPTAGAGVTPELCGDGLYDGIAGTAVFLAAAARCADDDKLADFARRALDGPADLTSPAFVDGVAGIAWAHATVGALLGDRGLVADAERLLLGLDLGIMLREPTDLLSGRAGLVLAAASVAVTAGSEALAAHAVALARRLEADWRDLVARGLHFRLRAERLGPAHGITGVALAIARTVAVSDQPDLRAFLDELLACENARIEARDGVPARVGASGRGAPDTGWCWGTAGFVVSRSVVDAVMGSAASGRHIERGRAITEGSLSPVRRLCCGAAGQLAALTPGTDPHRTLVADLAAEAGAYRLEAGTGHQSAGLFRGASGVGLELLRAARPDLVPSVLTAAPVDVVH